jgi:hypothetical protein
VPMVDDAAISVKDTIRTEGWLMSIEPGEKLWGIRKKKLPIFTSSRSSILTAEPAALIFFPRFSQARGLQGKSWSSRAGTAGR